MHSGDSRPRLARCIARIACGYARLRREGPGASDYTNALRRLTAAARPMHRAYRRRLGPAAARGPRRVRLHECAPATHGRGSPDASRVSQAARPGCGARAPARRITRVRSGHLRPRLAGCTARIACGYARLRREGPGASDYTSALRPPTAAARRMHRAYRMRLCPAAASGILPRARLPQRAPYLRL
jgi:hypothetical protein